MKWSFRLRLKTNFKRYITTSLLILPLSSFLSNCGQKSSPSLFLSPRLLSFLEHHSPPLLLSCITILWFQEHLEDTLVLILALPAACTYGFTGTKNDTGVFVPNIKGSCLLYNVLFFSAYSIVGDMQTYFPTIREYPLRLSSLQHEKQLNKD